MDGTRKPERLSLQARAAMLRRAQSRKRTLNVNRTPNAPLAPSMDNAVDALEVAWDSTQELVPDTPKPKAWRPQRASHEPRRFKPNRRDDHGVIYMGPATTTYGTHMKSRLTGKGRVWSVRNDAWARARSIEVGQAKLSEGWLDAQAEARMLWMPWETSVRPGNGTYARVWTPTGARPKFRDEGISDLSRGGQAPTLESLWAYGETTIDGTRYGYRFNRETAETRDIVTVRLRKGTR